MARLGQPHCPDCDVPDRHADRPTRSSPRSWPSPAGTQLYLWPRWKSRSASSYETLWEEIRARRATPRIRVDGQTYSLDQPADDRPPAQARRGGGDRPRDGPRRRRGRGSPAAWRTPWRWAAACSTWSIRSDDVPEPQWPVDVHSQHFVCERCGRSFEPLSPHNFSFNSALGWCPACEGWACRRAPIRRRCCAIRS